MALHLAEIARAVAPGAHAVLLLNQTGWHTARKLTVPANIMTLTQQTGPRRAQVFRAS